jgi:hypothetical protein
LQAEFDIALELFQNLLLEFADGALAFEQIANEEKGEHAEAEEGDAEGPLVGGVGVNKDERVHEDGQAAGEHEDKDGRHDSELKFAALETIELLPIDGCHAVSTWPLRDGSARKSDSVRSGNGGEETCLAQ